MKVELTSDYLRHVRFTIRRGNLYDACEVDAFMDALIEAVRLREHAGSDSDYTARLEAVCAIRADMTERILRALLEAEKKVAPLLENGENY